jgi:hypothetical protein
MHTDYYASSNTYNVISPVLYYSEQQKTQLTPFNEQEAQSRTTSFDFEHTFGRHNQPTNQPTNQKAN